MERCNGHSSVLLEEALGWARSAPRRLIYTMAPWARGHSRAVLAGLSMEGRLIGFGQGSEAIRSVQQLAGRRWRFGRLYKSSFADMAQGRWSAAACMARSDGVLLDLGGHRRSWNDAERGFQLNARRPADYAHLTLTVVRALPKWINSGRPKKIIERVLRSTARERLPNASARGSSQRAVTANLHPHRRPGRKWLKEAIPAWENTSIPAPGLPRVSVFFINQ